MPAFAMVSISQGNQGGSMDDGRLAADLARLFAADRRVQDSRFLRMDFPHDDGPPATALLVNSLRAHEEMSRDFRFEAELLSDNLHIPLSAMMGRMVTISMVRDDASVRHFNGYVGEFRLLRSDGGFAFYQMVLQPWLAFSRLRMDNVSFHERRVIDISETTFEHYLQRDWKNRLQEEKPILSCANQHNETDYNHLHRRWENQGIHYWYEHRADGHTLCLGDNTWLTDSIDPSDRYASVADEMVFRSGAGSLEGDGIRDWQAVRKIASGSLMLASFNYKQPYVSRASGHALRQQGDVFAHELYQDSGYGYAHIDDGDALAQHRLEQHNCQAQYFEAGGNHRCAHAGRSFTLGGHFSGNRSIPARGEAARPDIGSREYLILSVDHVATNNYQAGTGAKSHYENRFCCIRKSIRWYPGRHFNSTPCALPGVQTAIVTGPAGETIHADALGRVKVQFHWDRLGKFDAGSSPWIRVMTPWAGQAFGQVALPRVGQEVLIQFLDGNIDRPVIVGAVYNGNHAPPWHLPGQSVLGGWRSAELMPDGGHGVRGNQLVFDDTHQRIQAQLRSDHQHSQLSLGCISRIEDASGRKDGRGEGWELASDAWGVARAGRGMLLTTEARPGAASHIKSMDETLRRLAEAAERHKALAALAQHYGAQESAAQQGAAADELKAQHAAIKGAAGGEGVFPELAAPHLVLASPAGIETTSAQSTHIASAEHTALTTGRDLSLAAGGGLFASIGAAFRLFVHKAGMKLIAAAGPVQIAAQTDAVEIVANKVLELISQADWVNIRGRKGVRLHGADCMLEIGDKVQFFTTSPTLFHGNLETLAPKNRPQPELEPATGPVEGQLQHTIQAHAGGGLYALVPYTLYKGDAEVEQGLTDEFGRILIAHQDGTPRYRVVLGNGEEFSLQASACFEPNAAPDGEQKLSNRGLRALDDTTDGRCFQ